MSRDHVKSGYNAQAIMDIILDRYTEKTKTSKRFNQRAQESLPNGSTRTATHYLPYPVYMERGEGCFLYDVDGNSYLDLHNNYTSLIHGHAHPIVVKAVEDVLRKGVIRGAPTSTVIRHAEVLRERMKSLDLIRYCNSGTEATMFAIRSARAFTGKNIIVKTDGAYHGTHDMVDVNVWADPATDVPVPRLESRGIPPQILDTVAIVPFNNLSAVEQVFVQNKDQVAAVIVEPMMNGAGEIPAQAGYLKGLWELCNRYEVLLIFDEVVTFRLSEGGMQQIEDIQADLTALGKIIGGGFPVGAFGGRKDIMSAYDSYQPNSLSHSGTFNANEVTLAAGLATLECYRQKDIDEINHLGERLRRGLNQAFKENRIIGQATGLGSVATIHWRGGVIKTAHDAAIGVSQSAELYKLLHLEMINRGVFFPRRGQLALSTVMTRQLVDRVIEEFSGTLKLLKPYVIEVTPHLLID